MAPQLRSLTLALFAAVNSGFTLWFVMSGQPVFAAISLAGTVGPLAVIHATRGGGR